MDPIPNSAQNAAPSSSVAHWWPTVLAALPETSLLLDDQQIIAHKKGDFSLFYSGNAPKIGHPWDKNLTPSLLQRIAPLLSLMPQREGKSVELHIPSFHQRLDQPAQPLRVKLREIMLPEQSEAYTILSFEIISWLPEHQVSVPAGVAPANYLGMLEATVQQV